VTLDNVHAWLWLWVLFALATLLARRDRRLLYRLPLAGGVATLLAGAGTLAAWSLGMPDSRWPHLVLVVAGGLAMPLLTCWLRAYLRQDLPRCASCLRAVPAWPALCLALATLATTTYLILGRAVVARWGFCDDVTLFESDGPLYVRLMSGDVVGEHAITLKHPLFILFTRSLYLAAQPLSGMHTPVLLNALAGGAALALAAAYFHAVTGSRALALLLAVTLGISTAHLVFAALPETYAFSAAGLILLHLLLAVRPRHHVRLRHEVPAAALAIGITLTHAVTAAVCFFAARAWRSGWRASPRWAAGVLALLAVGLVVQTALVPASAVANAAGAVRAQQRHMTGELTPPITRAAYNVARGMLAENVVAPGLVVRADTDGHLGLHLGRYDSALGRVCLVFWWLLLAVAAALLCCRRTTRRPTLWAALVCLAGSAILHRFYGNAHVFLFSGTFTFYLFAVLAHALRVLDRRGACVLVAVLLVPLAVNNMHFCRQWLRLLAEALRSGLG
jgi:hypothetical protein